MDNKFRNHPSLMLEQLGVFGVIIITFLISSLDDLDEILGDIKNSDSTTLLIIILVILAVILFRLAVNTIVWYKTWITVDETSITITKNTIFRSVIFPILTSSVIYWNAFSAPVRLRLIPKAEVPPILQTSPFCFAKTKPRHLERDS